MINSLLTINTGSSSIKFCLFALDDKLSLLLSGKVLDIGGDAIFIVNIEETGNTKKSSLPISTTHNTALAYVIEWIMSQQNNWQLKAAAHRIVHGGERYNSPIYLDSSAIEYLRDLTPFAPLHQPHNILAIEALWQYFPDLPQYGCFDTAFHINHDSLRSSYALPEKIRSAGVRRYGFHGLSYEWITRILRSDYPHLSNGKIVAFHLGNGSSLCAIKDCQSIDTTMGMTALDGLPMGTRCGSIDAGAIIYMQRKFGLSVDELEHLLYYESGLKGLSGISNDVKILSESKDPRAKFALDYFSWKAIQYASAMVATLSGIDAVVFTGGIGENAIDLRESIIKGLSFLPKFKTLVIPANEEKNMAISIRDLFFKEFI